MLVVNWLLARMLESVIMVFVHAHSTPRVWWPIYMPILLQEFDDLFTCPFYSKSLMTYLFYISNRFNINKSWTAHEINGVRERPE
jgi:hypothetical protein